MSAEGALIRTAECLRYLADLIDAQLADEAPNFDHLLSSYIQTRGEMSRHFRIACRETLAPDPTRLQSVRQELEKYMARKYGEHIPSKYVRVRSYTVFHAAAYEMLVDKHPNAVGSSVLRVLSGDQVHTERRVRELRDIGILVEWRKSSGEFEYYLDSATPDLEQGATVQARARVLEDRSCTPQQREALLSLIEQVDKQAR